MKHKPIFLIGILVLLLVMSACSVPDAGTDLETASTDEPAPTDEGSGDGAVEVPGMGMPVMGAGLCANAYYPVREGATWNYTGTNSVVGAYSWTDTITGVSDNGFTLTSQFDSITRTQAWQCTPEGLLTLQLGGGPAGSITSEQTQLDLETQNVTGVTYPLEISGGDQWSHAHKFTGTMDIAGQAAEANGNESATFTALGMEGVTVPAGSFEAMKVEVVTTININSTFQGTTVPVIITGTTTSWFVQGIGWVKSVSTSEFGGIASSDTVELQSYSIP